MQKDPWMPVQPSPDIFMFMGGIIIHENMQVFLLVRLPFHRLDECEKLFMGMLLVTFPGYTASGNLEGGKQGTRPVSFIIMRDGSTAAFLE